LARILASIWEKPKLYMIHTRIIMAGTRLRF